MNNDDLCYMSATEALARFRARTLSPVELTGAIIHRAEAISETVNPFADCYFGEAMKRAKAAEAKYADLKTQALAAQETIRAFCNYVAIAKPIEEESGCGQ